MKIDYTIRGFRIATFNDTYGASCSVQESSCVTPCIWLGIGSNRMHLSQFMARDLAKLLTHFVKHGTLPKPRERGKSAAK